MKSSHKEHIKEGIAFTCLLNSIVLFLLIFFFRSHRVLLVEEAPAFFEVFLAITLLLNSIALFLSRNENSLVQELEKAEREVKMLEKYVVGLLDQNKQLKAEKEVLTEKLERYEPKEDKE